MLNINCILSDSNSECDMMRAPVKYVWNQTSAVKFQETLSSSDFCHKLKMFNESKYDNVNTMVQSLNSIICEAADISLKKSTRNNHTKKKVKTQKPKWYDFSLVNLRKELYDRSKLFTRYPKDPFVRGSFFSFLKFFRKSRNEKRQSFRANLINQLDSLRDDDPSKYWSLLDSLSSSEKKSNTSMISPAEWFEYFRNINALSSAGSLDIKEKLREIENEKIFSELDYKISEKEISDAICSLKNGKASGFDSILNEMLKTGHSFLLCSLHKLFNTVLSSGKFPTEWAKGIIVPIFKSGSKNDPANFRGITVGSCIAKLFTKILNCRLDAFLVKHKIICKEQIGFTKGKRTSDHMFIIKSLIEKYTQQGSKHLYTCFIDFKKAFDKVWHLGLLYKLRNAGISDLFYNIIKSMYEYTVLSVKVDGDSITNTFPSITGVRQGDNLSPNFF